MKNRKFPGPGNVPVELLKYGSEKLRVMLSNLFNRSLNGEKFHITGVAKFHITTIHKKGSKKDPKITEGLLLYAVLVNLLKNTERYKTGEIWGKEVKVQSGFRAGRSTLDNLFILRILTETGNKKFRHPNGFCIFRKVSQQCSSITSMKNNDINRNVWKII